VTRIRALVTPAALLDWQADPTAPPDISSLTEIDNDDPAAVTAREIAPDLVAEAIWTEAGAEVTSAGEVMLVLEARVYRLGGA